MEFALAAFLFAVTFLFLSASGSATPKRTTRPGSPASEKEGAGNRRRQLFVPERRDDVG